MTHICVGNLTITGSDNGLSPDQAIIWTNAGILLIGSLRTNFSEILIGFQTFSFKKMYLKMSSAKWRPFCLGLKVLNLLCIHCKCNGISTLLLYWIGRPFTDHILIHISSAFFSEICCIVIKLTLEFVSMNSIDISYQLSVIIHFIDLPITWPNVGNVLWPHTASPSQMS